MVREVEVNGVEERINRTKSGCTWTNYVSN